MEILANGTAVLTQRARQPGRIEKADEGESSLDEIKTSCEFVSSTIMLFIATVTIRRPHDLDPLLSCLDRGGSLPERHEGELGNVPPRYHHHR